MINLDPYVTSFVSGNWLSLTVLLTLLKGIALITPSTTDDKIYTLLSNLLGSIRGKPPVGVPPPSERGDADISG